MNRNLILIAISLGIWGLGEGLFIYFQPLNLERLGAEPAAIGGILGAAGLAMALAHIPAGYLSDRIGARPLMWTAWVIGFLATGIMAFTENLVGFVTGLLLYNFTAFVSSPMSSYVSSQRGKMSVGRALTLTSGFYSLGMIAGPQIGGLIGNQLGLSMVYRFAFVIFALSVLVIFFIQPNHIETGHHEHETNASLTRNRLFLGLLPLLALITFTTYMPQILSPNFLQNQQNLDLATIGGLGSLGSLSNAFFMIFLGNLKPVNGLLLGQVLAGSFSMLLLFSGNLVWYQLGYLLLGSTRLARSMGLAFARRFIRSDETGLAFGSIETLNGAALFLASTLAGLLYANQPSSLYSVGIILIAISIAISLVILPWLSRRITTLEK